MKKIAIVLSFVLFMALCIAIQKTYAARFINQQCTGIVIFGRTECTGYFTGDSNAQAGGDTMFVMPAMTDVFDRTAFVNRYQTYLYGSDEQQIVGAAATINLMLGLPGPTWGNNKAAGIQYAKDNFNRWATLVKDYDDKGLVDWDYNFSPIGLFTQTGYSKSAKDTFFNSSETLDSILVFRFRSPNGNPNEEFLIDKWCGNVKGYGIIAPLGSTISGRVFIDTNRDGVQNGAEQEYEGATVTRSGTPAVTAVTNASGDYTFIGVPDDTYTVSISVPAGYSTSTPGSLVVTVAPSATVNFGLALYYTITGNIFVDANKNGVKNGTETNHSGTPNITATRGGVPIGTVTTSSGGFYTITGLTPGVVNVSFTSLPTDYFMTSPLNGPPPTFQVTVGQSCSTNSAPGASCL